MTDITKNSLNIPQPICVSSIYGLKIYFDEFDYDPSEKTYLNIRVNKHILGLGYVISAITPYGTVTIASLDQLITSATYRSKKLRNRNTIPLVIPVDAVNVISFLITFRRNYDNTNDEYRMFKGIYREKHNVRILNNIKEISIRNAFENDTEEV
jgi:hypothetical protein